MLEHCRSTNAHNTIVHDAHHGRWCSVRFVDLQGSHTLAFESPKPLHHHLHLRELRAQLVVLRLGRRTTRACKEIRITKTGAFAVTCMHACDCEHPVFVIHQNLRDVEIPLAWSAVASIGAAGAATRQLRGIGGARMARFFGILGRNGFGCQSRTMRVRARRARSSNISCASRPKF